MPPSVTILVIWYSAIPYLLPSRPKPLYLTPPNLHAFSNKHVTLWGLRKKLTEQQGH